MLEFFSDLCQTMGKQLYGSRLEEGETSKVTKDYQEDTDSGFISG